MTAELQPMGGGGTLFSAHGQRKNIEFINLHFYFSGFLFGFSPYLYKTSFFKSVSFSLNVTKKTSVIIIYI